VEAFDAEIVAGDGGGAYVRIPRVVAEALGDEGRIPVRATFDGIDYRGSIVSMGDGHVLGVLKRIRSQLGNLPGDSLAVTVERDRARRSIRVPADLRAALREAGVGDAFAALSYTHRREHVTSIEAAKRPATRARRIAKTVERLSGDRPS
jgi:Domain of unknown function (DUF1905)/Bacteriocin-protection, YdeI or OmpD-Associated